jgi:hypothetical protein
MTKRLRLVIIVPMVAIILAALGGSLIVNHRLPKAHADGDLVLPVTHEHYTVFDASPPAEGTSGPNGQSVARHPPSPICVTTTSAAANVNTDCEGTNPHNETSIAVNPTNPLNMVGALNDYQLSLSPGGQVYETIYTRAHVTFDGGKTWAFYPIDFNSYVATGDPAVAFDADGNVYLATLGFLFSQGKSPSGQNPDVLVEHSTDGGKTWSGTVRVAQGSGSFGSVGTFNDKEYIAAWGHGNVIVTWTVFHDGNKGVTINSEIADVVSHDGGNTFTDGTVISGSAPFCTGAQGGNACDQGTVSVPTIGPDGRIFVAFEDTASAVTGRDQYIALQVDPATGQRVAGPFKVADLVDGVTDYPISIGGRQTYQDSEFRTWSAGNITADPTTPGHLAVVWSDMRNSSLPAPANPFLATTNSDVVVSQSFDGGATWSPPVALAAPGDQFMPWGAYDAHGRLRIGYFDRSYDPANHQYGYTLATETAPGALTFALAQLTTALSDPTSNDRWFSGGSPNHATTFLGDYSNIAATPSGGVVALWTDMRNTVFFPSRTGFGEDAYFATAP